MVRFLVVPQWQGSPAARAMLLVDGASAIAGDLPRAATTVLDVPVEAGESLGTGVRRLSALLRTRELVETGMTADTVIIGGDCSVTVAALAALPGGTDDLAVVWCDAHADLHTPDTSPSGAFSGMALRAVLGDGEPQLALSPGIPRDRVVTVGMRNLDDDEVTALDGLAQLSVDDLESPDAIADAVEATGARRGGRCAGRARGLGAQRRRCARPCGDRRRLLPRTVRTLARESEHRDPRTAVPCAAGGRPHRGVRPSLTR